MVIVQLQGVVRYAAKHKLFGPIDYGVQDTDRIGIIGPNGAGKSTLLRTLGMLEQPDEGQVVRARNAFASLIPQEETFHPGDTIYQVQSKRAAALEVPPHQVEARVSKLAGVAGFTSLDTVAASLSGGWKKRLAIVAGLVSDAPLVLLDEPTNHLDFDGIAWLEQLLQRASFAWMAISHDRMFLQNCAKRMLEINTFYPTGVFATDDNYEGFHLKKIHYLQEQRAQIQNLKNKLRTEEEWLSRQPKARTTKSKSRIDAAHAMQSDLRELSGRMRQSETNLGFSASGRQSKKLIELIDCGQTIGTKNIFSDFTFTVTNKSRIGVLGANGSGKSTLLKLLAGAIEPTSGQVERARDLNIVYFDQHRESLPDEATLGDALGQDGDAVVYRGTSVHIITWAKRFGFSPNQLTQKVASLSGGERAKVLIARLMLQNADILLLDEPTNDLDIDTIEELESSIADFPGAVVTVSHDRYLLDRVSSQYLGFVGDGRIISCASFHQWQKAQNPQADKSARAKSTTESETPEKAEIQSKKRLSYMEQREYDQMEERIFGLEAEIESIEQQMADPSIATNPSKLTELSTALAAKRSECESLYERWAELEGKLT